MSTPEGRAIYQNGSWQNEFAYTDHLGNTRVSFRANNGQLEKVAETAFDPWGVVLNGLGQTNSFQNRFEMQGKESEKTFGLNRINLGARTVNQTTGIFDRVDPLAEKYLSQSSYNYVHNNPVNAIDPDGRLVIFVNGQGPTNPLNNYWGGFDQAVNRRLNDYRNQYYDGSIGGWASTLGGGILTGLGNNLSSSNRYDAGYDKGYADAASLIANLARDDNGNITETIKIITHSMGGVFGSGLQNGILKYLSEHPELAKQVKISLMAHFDPFQADDITADSNVFTVQFMHKSAKNRKDSDGMGWLANEKVDGVDSFQESETEAAHGISSFQKEINSLPEGTYKWNGSKWVCQDCKQ